VSIETRATEELGRRIIDLRDKACGTVLGFRLNDFSEYRYSAGYVQALDDVVTVLSEIMQDIEKS